MTRECASSRLSSHRLLATNTLWNLIGQVLSMAAAVLAVPILVQRIGADRFGVLSLSWVVIGYFGLFDLGMGRALTGIVADRIGSGREDEIPSMVWSALLLMLLLGACGAVVLALASPWLVHTALRVPTALQAETLSVFYLLAASLPLVTSTSGLRGVLEAEQRFGTLNAIRTPMSLINYGAPIIVLSFSHSLVAIVCVLLVARVIGWAAHLAACLRARPALRRGLAFQRSSIRPVLKLGAWLTVSNIVGPVMVYLDRFAIGALASMAAVAYYTAPFEMVSRLAIVPGALVSVLFPAFAFSFAQESSRAGRLLRQSVTHTFMVLFPIALVIMTFAHEGLQLWLGPSFADHSAPIMRWLTVGALFNCVALVPFTFVQGIGRPDVTAKLHLLELSPYLLVLYWAIGRYGVAGAAIAGTLRVTFDTVLMFYMAHRLMRGESRFLRQSLMYIVGAAMVLGAATLVTGLAAKTAFVLAASAPCVAVLVWPWRSMVRAALRLPNRAVARGLAGS